MMIEEEIWDQLEVPPPAALVIERPRTYGGVAGLPDEELADPDELERQVMVELSGPSWPMPRPRRERGRGRGFRGRWWSVDEDGRIDGAFGTWDFQRRHPGFGREDERGELRRQLHDLGIIRSIVRERLPASCERVLGYLRRGLIAPEHLASEDMRALAQLDERIAALTVRLYVPGRWQA